MMRHLLALGLAAAPLAAPAQTAAPQLPPLVSAAPLAVPPVPAPSATAASAGAYARPAAAMAPPPASGGAASASQAASSPVSTAPKSFTPPANWVVIPRQPSAATPTAPSSVGASAGGFVPPSAPGSYAPVTPPPVVAATLPPRPTLPPNSLLNQSEAQVRARLGQPQIARREAGGAMWTYAGEACALMVFFQVQGREGLRVTGAQAGPRQRGQRAPETEACIAATAAAPNRG